MGNRGPCLGALWAAAVLSSTTAALGNGRFPRAERLIENPIDSHQLAIAGTYGILTTSDRGRNWYHICEASFSLQDAYLGDPLLDLTADQSFWVGVQTSLNVSHDHGCHWDPVWRGDSAFILDDTFAFARSEPSTVFALLANYEGGGIKYSLQASTDHGATWTALGGQLPADIVYTIDVDPGDGTHLYATALLDDVGRLLTSTDGGTTWTSQVIPNTNVSDAPYLAGLHPRDPDKIFVRTDAWVTIDGALTANDALLYSPDGGQSWSELFRSRAKLYGFALSPDGSTVLIGYGDPREGAGQVVSGPFGVFKSSTDAFAFRRTFAGRVGCLAWTKTGVYVCGSQSFDGFELAFSPDADFDLDAGCLTPLLVLDQVRGPLACGAGGTSDVCGAAWDLSCATFGACAADAAAPPEGCIGASRVAKTPDAGEGAKPGPSAPTITASGGAGCACSQVPARESPGPAVLGLWGLVLFRRPGHRARRARALSGAGEGACRPV